jgi:predicted metal-dependent HD superfamily phosphohydrolase
MTTTENQLIRDTEKFVRTHFAEKVPEKYVFHDIHHVASVVDATLQIAAHYKLTDKELEILQLAGWFHDTGYDMGPENHEDRSATYARDFLNAKKYPKADIQAVEQAILATKTTVSPQQTIEKILCDADLSHLGSHLYWDCCGKVRQELAITRGAIVSEQEWIESEIEFMEQHEYHTEVGEALFGELKEKHIKQLKKHRLRLHPNELEQELLRKQLKKEEKEKKKSKRTDGRNDIELKDLPLGRGVETMFRSTYRTHISLSSIADSKANLMLSINAIIISIIVSTLVPKFTTEGLKLIIPTVVLLSVCLIAIIFATLSTRPKVTEGKFTREDIKQKRSNLMFFGNYYNMSLEDFHWGMIEMIRDSDFLYSSMTRDLYYLGKVLSVKYKYLSICYNVFMYGLIVAVVIFAISFSIPLL